MLRGSGVIARLERLATEALRRVDAGALAALTTTAVTMLALRKPLPAIAAGIAAAGIVRFLA